MDDEGEEHTTEVLVKKVKNSKGIWELRDSIAVLSMKLTSSTERAIAMDLGALEILMNRLQDSIKSKDEDMQ